jgi:mitogen-activated protein kinase kinase 3
MLISRLGQVKICDFGISGYLENSVAKTIDAGCKPYMAPERIDPSGDPSAYNIRSDVWSLGISIVEVATGSFPYPRWGTPFDQLKQVVVGDAPRLPTDKGFSPDIQDLVTQCLQKDFTKRPGYIALLNHPFISALASNSASQENFSWPELAEFVSKVLDS